jgi:hypothetical protein
VIGCSEFCGYYDWTFEWLRRNYGEQAVRKYWEEAICRDSQTHARELIIPKGIAGMVEYWGHTLAEEEAGYTCCYDEDAGYYRIDMYACPSKGYNLEHGYAYYHDYCDHCMGWIKPIMDEAGFVIHHDHNHAGMCWWEIRRAQDDPGPSGPGELTESDVRLREDYDTGHHHTWRASVMEGAD